MFFFFWNNLFDLLKSSKGVWFLPLYFPQLVSPPPPHFPLPYLQIFKSLESINVCFGQFFLYYLCFLHHLILLFSMFVIDWLNWVLLQLIGKVCISVLRKSLISWLCKQLLVKFPYSWKKLHVKGNCAKSISYWWI